MNRYNDALMIQESACNPKGIANTFLERAREIEGGTDDIKNDPALRLIVHQLAFLMGVYQIDNDLTTYGELRQICQDRADPQ